MKLSMTHDRRARRHKKRKTQDKKGELHRAGRQTPAGSSGPARATEPTGAAQATATRTAGSAAPAIGSTGGLTHAPRSAEFEARYRYELDELRASGYEPEEGEVGGRRITRVNVPLLGTSRPMMIVYPDLYPWTRFEVYADPDLRLPKHQNPIGGNLCLLDRSTRAWIPSLTAARVLDEQIPRLERSLVAGGPTPDLEANQAEPVTTFYRTLKDSIVIVPIEAQGLRDAGERGTFELALSSVPGPTRPLRAVVTAIDGRAGSLPDLAQAFPPVATAACRYMAMAQPPIVRKAEELEALAVRDGFITAQRPRRPETLGFTFPEEVGYGKAPEAAWLFLVRSRDGVGLVVGERYARHEQSSRIRDIAELENATMLLVGLGALGAPAAHLLLQSRIGRLRLVDRDELELGNAVRWPLGFAAAGRSKLDAFTEFARSHYPASLVEPLAWGIGSSTDPAQVDERELLEAALSDVDLVVDTSAELGIQQLLAHECRERGIPFILGEAREGAYGGLVTRLRPDGPCWHCLKWHQEDERFLPPLDATTGTVQPRGCATPTFTGAAFDLAPISAQVARLAAQTLIASERFPDARWDVAVLASHVAGAAEEYAALPRWDYSALTVHPSCTQHGGA